MAFKGYYLKCGDCTFQSPAISRDGYRAKYKIVQVSENNVLASGLLSIKTLEHKPSIAYIDFPPMLESQWAEYCKAFRGELTGEEEMHVTYEMWIPEIDNYITVTCYHTDLDTTSTIYNHGQRFVQPPTVEIHEL
jgi:hypothetical protein